MRAGRDKGLDFIAIEQRGETKFVPITANLRVRHRPNHSPRLTLIKIDQIIDRSRFNNPNLTDEIVTSSLRLQRLAQTSQRMNIGRRTHRNF